MFVPLIITLAVGLASIIMYRRYRARQPICPTSAVSTEDIDQYIIDKLESLYYQRNPSAFWAFFSAKYDTLKDINTVFREVQPMYEGLMNDDDIRDNIIGLYEERYPLGGSLSTSNQPSYKELASKAFHNISGKNIRPTRPTLEGSLY